MIKNSVKKLGLINTMEGYSYLALLFIGMPLKYYMDFPVAVKIFGILHGVLFVTFCLLLLTSWQKTKWKFSENIIFFLAVLIPFGTFFTSRKIQSYE
ncbi:DUF3817 domain-containing protein [Sulfurimonas sp.]|jgi:integral membrane protein|uniref:DUF3817 domain-containing protein n=1 Tax=Sulfurimonas sp. TaxID=2022749 RepID=UPI0025D75771|nr:DUF3817 domain-containing protein [Sulfurimonas sp.]MBT5935522.1 DUF3817 domain-containing protein [Sulfurimonas sp.]